MLTVFKHISFKHNLFGVLFFCAFCTSSVFSQYANIDSDSLLVLGNEVYRTGKYSESETIYRKALKKHAINKNSNEWIIASVGLGASLLDQGHLIEGRKWMMRADSSVSESTPLELQAYVKSNLGWVYKIFRDYPLSYENYTSAFSLAKESGDEYRIAQVSNSLSSITFQLGYYGDAIKYGQVSVDKFEEAEDLFLLSIAYGNLSKAYEALSFIDKAEETLLRSYDIKKQFKNEDLISTSHFYLGSFYHRTGNFDKALTYYSKYLSFVEEKLTVNFIAPAYGYIGTVYFSLGEFEKALEYFNQGKQLSEKHNLAGSIENVSRIALTYQKLGRYDLAETIFEKALNDFEEKNDFQNTIDTYLRLSELNLIISNYDRAKTLAETALSLSLDTESKQLKAKSFAAVGKSHAALGENKLALDFSRKAFNVASLFKGYRLADYSIALANAHFSAGNDSAFFFADYAFSEIEREQQSIYGDNLESGVFSNYADFYNEVAYWYLKKKGDIEKAFEVTERGRSRVLLERLSISDSKLENTLDDEVLIMLRQKEKEIDKIYRQLEVAANANEVSLLKDQLRALELDYQSYSNDLRLQFPELKSVSEPELIAISGIQNKLTKNEALVEYMITEDHLVSFWITKNEAISHSIAIDSSLSSGEYISELVSRFRTSIQEQASVDVLEEQSLPLYNLLLEPFINRFKEINNLIIVPEKSLSVLPFDALRIDNSFLVERLNIKYLPSASIYSYIKPPHRTVSKDLFSVAGSGFNNETSTGKNYSSLPSTLLEVDAISAEFEKTQSLKNQYVSESNIKTTPLNEFRYLHFATHGKVNAQNPQQSGLLISESNDSESIFEEDGFLNSKEISSLDLNADMVVLSACNTAVGKIINGEGLQGLQRSFFKAGASSVVVSLWNVYDKSTASFMGMFYQNLNRLEDEEIGLWNRMKIYFNTYDPPMFGYKERALHQAKKEMLEHPYYNHPVYWAPFIMLGK